VTSIKTGGESKIQNGLKNIGRELRGSIAFDPKQVPNISKEVVCSPDRRWRKLLQIKGILLCFRHEETSRKSGLYGVIERLLNVSVRIGCYCNLSQRDKSVGHNRKREEAH
jgi:hypothetical protein